MHFPTSNRQAAIPVPQSPESAAKELPTAVVTVREPGAQYTIELNKDGLHLSFSDWSDEDRDEEHGETTYAAMDVPGLVSKYAAFREVHSIPLADLPQMLVQDYSRRGFFNYDRMIRHLDKLHQTPTGSQRL